MPEAREAPIHHFRADDARESALDRLLSVWGEMTGNHGRNQPPTPALVTLVGDSGTGKTRLIREFYARIAADQSYWPQEISSETASVVEERKAISPDYEAGSYKGEDEQPPFIWAGIDCS